MISISEQGRKHKPIVKIENNTLIITIGMDIEHPMLEKHLIDTVDILKYTTNGLLLVKTIKLTSSDKPELSFNLEEFEKGTYEVQSRCNLHGTWSDIFIL